jgi:hypothetical protein
MRYQVRRYSYAARLTEMAVTPPPDSIAAALSGTSSIRMVSMCRGLSRSSSAPGPTSIPWIFAPAISSSSTRSTARRDRPPRTSESPSAEMNSYTPRAQLAKCGSSGSVRRTGRRGLWVRDGCRRIADFRSLIFDYRIRLQSATSNQQSAILCGPVLSLPREAARAAVGKVTHVEIVFGVDDRLRQPLESFNLHHRLDRRDVYRLHVPLRE